MNYLARALRIILTARRWLGEGLLRLRLWWRLIADPRVPETLKLLLPAAGLIYIVWPADLIPDIIPLLGQGDDLALLLLALHFFESLAPRRVVEEHLHDLRRPRSPRFRQPRQPRESDGDVIDGEYRVL